MGKSGAVHVTAQVAHIVARICVDLGFVGGGMMGVAESVLPYLFNLVVACSDG